jgi:hypothetical protein
MSAARSVPLYRKRPRVSRWTEEEQHLFQTLLEQDPGIRDPWLFTEVSFAFADCSPSPHQRNGSWANLPGRHFPA